MQGWQHIGEIRVRHHQHRFLAVSCACQHPPTRGTADGEQGACSAALGTAARQQAHQRQGPALLPASPPSTQKRSVSSRAGSMGLTSTESRFSRVTKLLVRGSTSLPMRCSSHTIGASAASKIFCTASAISGPMPAGCRDGGQVCRQGAGQRRRQGSAGGRATLAEGGPACHRRSVRHAKFGCFWAASGAVHAVEVPGCATLLQATA